MVQPLLVTGSNRSGTTWVGTMLCQSRQYHYVYEPFNPDLLPRWTARKLPYRNLYVCAENEARYAPVFDRVMGYRFPLLAQVGGIDSPRRAGRVARDWARGLRYRVAPRPPLVKDPIAIFSSEWLAQRYAMDVLVMIRNPVAFVGSIKRKQWRFDFRNLLGQELLMRDHLAPFEREIVAMTERPPDIIDEAILLWNVHYHVVDRFRERQPAWRFVEYDGLANTPRDSFRELFEMLGLRWDGGVERRIARFSDEGNAKEVATDDRSEIRRDSKAATQTWRHRLSAEEIQRVRDGCAEVAARFYDQSAWMVE